MRLMTAHKILISTGCVFFALFAILQWRRMGAGQPGAAVAAGLGAAATVTLAGYLATLRGK